MKPLISVRKYIIPIIIAFGLNSPADVYASLDLKPAENDTLNYTQVLFQWQPNTIAYSYQLQVARYAAGSIFDSSIVQEHELGTYSIIVEDLDWGNEYLWRIISKNSNNARIDTSEIHSFSIMPFPDEIYTFEVESLMPEEYSPGLTIFALKTGNAFAMDIDGKIRGLFHGYSDYEMLPNGNFLYTDGESGPLREVVESDLDGNDVVRTGLANYHHEIDKLPNGNYIGLCNTYREIDDPFGADTSRLWKGDLIVEIDIDGDTVWSWDIFDHISTDDFDMRRWEREINRSVFDWTHTNTVHLTPDEDALYISVRNLSRITMISYPEGEIIWSMGKEFDSGEVDFGHDLNFSYQHDPEMLENGNILMYDNHNLGPEDSSRAIEISFDEDELEAEIVWECWIDTLCLSGSDADRLPNGNTLLANSQVKFLLEVNQDCEHVWRCTNTGEGYSGWFYRAERIPDLYPLRFSIIGPHHYDRVPACESYFHFTINNLGWAAQSFNFEVTDSEGWFLKSGVVEVDASQSRLLTIRGECPDGIATDTINIAVYPIRSPGQIHEWNVIVQSDTSLTANDKIEPPFESALLFNYPNPFNVSTRISFNLTDDTPTNISIYSITGVKINELVNRNMSAGNHQVLWRGVNSSGEYVPSGIYSVILRTDYNLSSKRLILLK